MSRCSHLLMHRTYISYPKERQGEKGQKFTQLHDLKLYLTVSCSAYPRTSHFPKFSPPFNQCSYISNAQLFDQLSKRIEVKSNYERNHN